MDATVPISVPELSVRAVAKVFATAAGPVRAVDHIDFDVRQGEFVAVLGPSGCGKTTLLRMIGALEAPSEGDVAIAGQSLWRDGGAGTSERRAVAREAVTRLAFAFQEARLFPWFTIEENIALPLRVRGRPRGERLARARELCALVGLKGFETARPRQLSPTAMRLTHSGTSTRMAHCRRSARALAAKSKGLSHERAAASSNPMR